MGDHPEVVLASPVWSLNGPNVFSRNLARGLRGRQIPAHIVLTRPDWIDAKPLPLPLDVPVEVLPVRPFMSLRTRWKAMTRYLEERAPCIYVPNYDVGHSCISARLSRRVAIVGIVHSDDRQHYEHVARLGRYWNAIVAVSATIAEEILKIDASLSGRLSVIPYGVGSAATFPIRSSETPRCLRVIYAGRLDRPQKRVDDIPKIVKAAAKLGVPVQLTIAGAGPQEVQLRSMCAADGLSVKFLGTLDSDALAAVLARQDVFLLVSAFEGMPISVFEAMGQGCIPLVSDIRSGVREVIADGLNGFRVATGDIDAFATRLSSLYENPELRRRMSHEAYRTVCSPGYQLDGMVQSYVSLFGKVMDDVRRGRFLRPAGAIQPPRNLPWAEYLPESIQKSGSRLRRLVSTRRV